MRTLIAEHRPEDGIDGEEYGRIESRSGWMWHLDPVDGTGAFLAGSPTWTVLIGLSYENERLFGLIDQPFLGERYGGDGRTAFLETGGTRLRLKTRPLSAIGESILATVDYFLFTEAERHAFEMLRASVGVVRYGLDAYAAAQLAAGRIDLVVEAGLRSHDMEAWPPIIEGAGGVMTDWRGAPPGRGGRIVAAGDARGLDAALAILETVPVLPGSLV